MITYVYEHCDDRARIEIKQSIKDEPLEHCPECGKPIQRVVSGGAMTLYKGQGWPRKDGRADRRVEERLNRGERPGGIVTNQEIDYHPGPGEGYVEL